MASSNDSEVAGFVRRINRRSKSIGVNADRATKSAAKAMLEEVVYSTPADTGKARSNWRAGIGAPNLGVRSPYAPGKKLGLAETANAEAAVKAGRSVINRAPENSTLFISNNVAYIGKLNAGSSAQAPANFVERALERGSAAARRTRLLTDGS